MSISIKSSSSIASGTLTIGFARRFATYKRATLLFADPDRLARFEREAQAIVDAGIATPEDVDRAMMTGRNWPAGFFGERWELLPNDGQ